MRLIYYCLCVLFLVSCSSDGKKVETFIVYGSGNSSLVSTSQEPSGSNCTFGGVTIQTGTDSNRN